ncbi:hypothetical protein JC606_17960 [Vibrio sp. IB15]|uniref:hypothetical protein n=1 Tax=Vibrio TaxID=662 RepID=UPI0007B7E708|nr:MULTISPECIES: hypothetical protein [Vibrio]KZX63835.1 hypothetical protein A3712_20640 [Vibrio sp. HI00D65]MBJ2148246.1 hypothetical protein [Vibrio sp. IB15]PMG66755.1 hypothetical protein BCU86_12830 [Vibrio lentus]
MALTTTQNHNGISLEVGEPLGPMGGVDNQLGGMIGLAPNKHPDVPYGEPIKLYTTADLAKIDTTENPAGVLYCSAKYFLEVAQVPCYVIIEKPGADADETLQNIVGGVSPSGRLTGIAAFAGCKEAPTNVAAPGFHGLEIANALAALANQTYCEGWTDAPDFITKDAKEYAGKLGESHKRVWCCDVSGERWRHTIPPSVVGMAARCSVKPSQTPNGAPVPLDDIARLVGYRVNDKNSEAVDLNKKGIALTVRDPNGGLMFLGTRTADGSFGNIIGIENQLCRELIKSHRDTMKSNLDFDFFNQRVAQLNNWLASLQADGEIIGAKCYLHTTRNNLQRYKNGEWVLVVDWGAYRPNEHSIIELNQSDEILQVYIDSAVKSFS